MSDESTVFSQLVPPFTEMFFLLEFLRNHLKNQCIQMAHVFPPAFKKVTSPRVISDLPNRLHFWAAFGFSPARGIHCAYFPQDCLMTAFIPMSLLLLCQWNFCRGASSQFFSPSSSFFTVLLLAKVLPLFSNPKSPSMCEVLCLGFCQLYIFESNCHFFVESEPKSFHL